jgi:hypothetical protein
METKGINIATIPLIAIRVLTSPSVFFREMPKSGGFLEPLIFVVFMGIIVGFIQSILSILGLNLTTGMATGAASIIIFPIFIAIFSFVVAAILFVIWKLTGSKESYEAAYRCAAYISALTPITSILGVVPYIGAVISIALTTFFLVIASIEVHKIPSNKAWMVFGIIGLIFLIISISGECTSRKLMNQAGRLQREFEESSKIIQKKADEAEKAAEEARKTAEEMKKQLQDTRPDRK